MKQEELLELNVDEQKQELENLELDELKDLREAEERNTAIDNIDLELGDRKTDTSNVEPDENVEDVEASNDEDDRSELEELKAKVDYLLEKGKTVSREGFEDYED